MTLCKPNRGGTYITASARLFPKYLQEEIRCVAVCVWEGGDSHLCTTGVPSPRPAFRRLQYGKRQEGPGNNASSVHTLVVVL